MQPPWRHHLDWGLLLPEASSLALLPSPFCFEWSQKWPFWIRCRSGGGFHDWIRLRSRGHTVVVTYQSQGCQTLKNALFLRLFHLECWGAGESCFFLVMPFWKEYFPKRKNRKKNFFSKEKQNFFSQKRKKNLLSRDFFLVCETDFFFFERKFFFKRQKNYFNWTNVHEISDAHTQNILMIFFLILFRKWKSKFWTTWKWITRKSHLPLSASVIEV